MSQILELPKDPPKRHFWRLVLCFFRCRPVWTQDAIGDTYCARCGRTFAD